MFKKEYLTYFKLLPFLFVVFILFKLVNNFEIISYIFSTLTKILYPFLLGFGIAFFINPFMKNLELKFKFNRFSSLCLSYAIVLGLIYFLITVIYPSLITTLSDIFENIPTYIANLKIYFDNTLQHSDFIGKDIIISYINNSSTEFMKDYGTIINTYLSMMLSFIFQLGYNIFQIIFGLIISIYMLKDKENFKNKIRRAIIALFSSKTSEFLLDLGNEANIVFSQFIIGKIIDSTIIGILCFIGLVLFNFKYALLISLIIGITNMIPYFGPLFGITPAVFITLFDSPVRAFWIGIFTFILLQFDGMYLGPKILSDKVGLSPFLVILAIIIGGGLFGILGMFFGVPTFSLIKTFFERYITKKLKEKEKQKGKALN